jgi:hypothetical protein
LRVNMIVAVIFFITISGACFIVMVVIISIDACVDLVLMFSHLVPKNSVSFYDY